MSAKCVVAITALMFGSPDPDYQRLLNEAKLSLPQAVDRGLAEAKTGVVVAAELEEENGKVVWSIDVAQGKETLAILIDAKTGAVVERSSEKEDWSAAAAAAKVPLVRAVELVLAGNAGKAVSAELQLSEGRPEIAVKLFDRGNVKTATVDGVTERIALPQAGKPAQQKGEEEEGEEEEAEEGEEEEAEAGEEPEEKGEQGEEEEEAGEQGSGDGAFTSVFGEEDSDLGPTGRNPYFVLEPGYGLVLEGQEDGKPVVISIVVLAETKQIDGVQTRVVQETETKDGKIEEVTRDYFAISRRTNNVYYFGEDVDVYKDGVLAGHEGAWLAGQNGARYGMIMPASPLLGARYQQEVAPGVAMDRAVVKSLAGTFECAAGKFDRVLRTVETNPLKQGERESKLYAPGVGLLRDGDCTLVRYGMGVK